MSAIRLHPTAGLNPKLGVCLYCGREDGTVVLPGAAVKNTDSRHLVHSPLPCDKCLAEAKAQGAVLLLEADVDDRPSRRGKPNPTGRLLGVRPEFIEANFAPEMAESVLKVGVAWVDPTAFQHILDDGLKADALTQAQYDDMQKGKRR